MRVIVVGSGLAGLMAALEAATGAEVLLISKGALAEANTAYAQGGVAVSLWPDDSPAAHSADTVRAGAGLCDPAAVAVLTEEGPERVRQLIALGARFDRDGAQLARGLEAAHSAARIVHAGGDATGAEIERALIARVTDDPRIAIRERTALAELLRDSPPGGSVPRVIGVELADGTREYADAVILATGGAGQLFAHTTNPAVATGDGVAAAWRAGAVLADAEFYQFHPTALAVPGSFLISEAVRGEGAVLRNADGERFMTDAHPDAELAPRDVVARAIAVEMAAQDGRPVVLDATALGAARLARRFPTIDRVVRRAGFDWSREPVPVTPAAHYWMGGIATDLRGRTSLSGLWAAGECAATGVHGANRLASNSLLEAAVFGVRAGRDAVRASDNPTPGLRTGQDDVVHSTAPAVGSSGRLARHELQRLMWRQVGLQRSGEGLRQAASVLDGATGANLEDRNLLDVARVVVAAALAREESRGAHYRSDFPVARAEFARRSSCSRETAPAC
ncbi:L-aspartate oxidase [Gryllotalpicola sp.]|uniref:L-aspartate oxidase n=1 Tax=Gryllotalpicola sp. TaxID=1932787 RepID=UPI0026264786|nr:L-aspartate oxidase [Gryllotalpicola sp.]